MRTIDKCELCGKYHYLLEFEPIRIKNLLTDQNGKPIGGKSANAVICKDCKKLLDNGEGVKTEIVNRDYWV